MSEFSKEKRNKKQMCPICMKKNGIVPIIDEDNILWYYCYGCYTSSRYKAVDHPEDYS